MNEENTKELYELAPELYSDHTKPMNETCMCWGFECSSGWMEPLRSLTSKLHALNLFLWDYGVVIKADQVKEKYGTLRFYYHIELDNEYKGGKSESDRNCIAELIEPQVDELIKIAEQECYDRCELCGAHIRDAEKSDWKHDFLDHQRIQTPGWITYICRKCALTPNQEGNLNYGKDIDKYLTGPYGNKIRNKLKYKISRTINKFRFWLKFKVFKNF